MLHTWIPNRIGLMPPEQPAEAREYWISEGFTDYYAMRMLVAAGVWSPTEFTAYLNRTLARYAASPVRTAPDTRIAADFWSNYDVQQLPYYRGMLFATLLDQRLRKKSAGRSSLDDVMHAMQARFRNAPLPIRSGFVSAMAAYGEEISGDIEADIENGESILLPADTFAECGTVSTESQTLPGGGEPVQLQLLKPRQDPTAAQTHVCAVRLGAAP